MSKLIVTVQEYLDIHFGHFGKSLFGYHFHIDTILMSSIIGFASLYLFRSLIAVKLIRSPSSVRHLTKGHIVCEMIFDYISKGVSLPRRSSSYSLVHSFGLTSLIWVMTLNLLDLFPTSLASCLGKGMSFNVVSTEDLNFSLSLALVTLLISLYVKFRSNGFLNTLSGYLTKPLGVFAFPINFILSMAEIFTPLIALAVRLFGNMFSGGMIFALCAIAPAQISWMFTGLWSLLHLPTLLIQAVVFAEMSLSYLQRSH